MRPAEGALPWFCAIAACLSIAVASREGLNGLTVESRRLLSIMGEDIEPPAGNVSYAAAKKLYLDVMAKKPFDDVVEKTENEFCLAHSFFFWRPACDKQAPGYDPKTCCAALQAFVDEGLCLCHPLELAQSGNDVLRLLQEVQCPVEFPLPEVEDPMQFFGAVLRLRQCLPAIQLNPVGRLNPDFVGLTPEELNNTAPDDLPTFLDLYEPPPSGPFDVSVRQVKVSRPEKSVIVNNFSTPYLFDATLVYPANKMREVRRDGRVVRPVLARSGKPFPVIAYSPGFTGVPRDLMSTLRHLASQGYIVISQASTQTLDFMATQDEVQAWSNDIAFMLRWVINLGRNKRSFLRCGVDDSRVGVAGISMGGALVHGGALKAMELGIDVHAIASLLPVCVPWAQACDSPTAAIPKLRTPDFLFMAAEFDWIAPQEHAKFFESLVPESASTEFHFVEGSTHCIGDGDPKFWPISIIASCGQGTKSPPDAVAESNEVVGEFFKKAFVDDAAKDSDDDDSDSDDDDSDRRRPRLARFCR